MSARQELIVLLAGGHESNYAAMTPVADAILNNHARELAAAIRSEARAFGGDDLDEGAHWAADLIDPDEEP